MMKKSLLAILTFLLLLNGKWYTRLFAEEEEPEQEMIKYVLITDTNVNVRTGPSTSYPILKIDGANQTYKYGQLYPYLSETTDEQQHTWYQLQFGDYQTWVYGEYASVKEYQVDETYDFEKELNNFPESYRDGLVALHKQHPNWIFKAYFTDIDWAKMISAETTLGRSLIQTSNLDYRSKQSGAYNASTGQYIPLDGNTWFQAHPDVVAYYIDPRNFLNQEDIFMFLKLTYSSNETPEAVQTILNGTFMQNTDPLEGKNYRDLFVLAGEQANVSSIYLSTLAIQEQGVNGSAAVTGAAFTLDGVRYSGLYNFYNIGATAGTDNWKKGLRYAAGTNEKYNLPWTSPEKAIVGGAKWIASGYIDAGQDTLYFQKFNSYNGVFWHQYQTNVKAAYSESYTIYQAYRDSKALESAVTFTIPVYLNMPEKTALPNGEITLPPVVDPEEQTGFIAALNLSERDGYLSGFSYGQTTAALAQQIQLVDDTLNVQFKEGDDEITDETVLYTGMKLLITDGENNEETYVIIIKGDVNGDHKISALDYVAIKNHIMQTDKLTQTLACLAADYNDDGKITALDYVGVKNCIMAAGD